MAYIKARVSGDAYDGWRYFADRHGISVSSLVEAAGMQLAEWVRRPVELGPVMESIIATARDIDTDRRRRR